jgi:hypothetical protein
MLHLRVYRRIHAISVWVNRTLFHFARWRQWDVTLRSTCATKRMAPEPTVHNPKKS